MYLLHERKDWKDLYKLSIKLSITCVQSGKGIGLYRTRVTKTILVHMQNLMLTFEVSYCISIE